MNKNILSSLLAFETSLILSLIVFFSLINPRFYYSKRVIFVCCFITLFWFVLTLFSTISSKKNKKITAYLISALVFLLIIFYMIRTVWFHSYLSLTPEYAFFNKVGNSDTFYLSGLCEAIKNYGYPALLSQGLVYHKYHYFSIVLLAIISKIVGVPCLVVYNFLYPVVFLPMFAYLFFQAVGVVREYLSKNQVITISDIVFSIFVIVGFLPLRHLYAIHINWYTIFLSESYCVSLVLILMYVFVIGWFNNKKNGKKFIIYMITPFFLFLITATKISVGVIFFILLAWIFIRTQGFKLSSVLSVGAGFVLLLFSLSLFVRESQNINEKTFTWFHYITSYVSPEYWISHLFFILFPSLVLLVLSKGTQSFGEFVKTKNAILAEAALITTFCSILPGIFFEIEGGSASYFFLPALFVSLFILLCSSKVQLQFANFAKESKIILFMLLLVIYGESFINESYNYGSICISNTPPHMIEQWQAGKQGNELVVENRFFKTLNKINRMTTGKKKQYCLLVTDSCEIFKLYKNDNYYFVGSHGLLAITAYLGLPVINTIEEAKEMHIDNILVLEKDIYKIINSK